MTFRRFFALFLACSITAGPAYGVGDTPPAPNIILFMADDMGLGDTSAYQDFTGNSDELQIATPAMEKLARMGVRFTDAHTPASRCTPTRYGLLTGRYPWRSRMKYWVLYGSQGDPLIEPDRPTLATLLRDQGYATGMVGKWHVGLRYQRSDGTPAAGFEDADFTLPMHDGPLQHGFQFARFTSRSHKTSGPDNGTPGGRKNNTPDQDIGPGHIHGSAIIGATGDGRQLAADGPAAYVLTKLGGRHSDNSIEFLDQHIGEKSSAGRPFFLYYASNSNHSPYTPDSHVGGKPVIDAGRNKSGKPMPNAARGDYVYENDVALARLIDFLETREDPRYQGHKLIDNTLVIFTSDNGAEIKDKYATGPFRSNKGSCYEGGHRVPLIAAWPAGKIGDGDTTTPGADRNAPVVLTDLFATFADILEQPLPDPAAGERGAEDSISMLPALRGETVTPRPPLFVADHNEAKTDPAVAAMRLDSPNVGEQMFEGQWKAFFTPDLLRAGKAKIFELYDLTTDPEEETNLVEKPELAPLIAHLRKTAVRHRNSGGHRLVEIASGPRTVFDWVRHPDLINTARAHEGEHGFHFLSNKIKLTVDTVRQGDHRNKSLSIHSNPRGIGIAGGGTRQVDDGEAFAISFDQDVLIESVAIAAGNGTCGGSCTVGNHSPLAIYCIDADNDSKEQQGIMSDLGVLRAGEKLTLSSSPHLGNEAAGQWRLQRIAVRALKK